MIPQKITHADSYFAYTAGFRWDAEKSMIPRVVLAKALMSEGIPVFTAYGRMLSEHPTFQNKIGFGKEHYPWNLTEKGKNLNYDNSLFPIAEKLIKEEKKSDEFTRFLKIIKPAINYLSKKNYKISGPFPADTLFLKKNIKKFDVIIGMYHDQVLTPIKTIYEFDAINITLGLPFIRISPDHGPNQKMLGQNKSNPLSLIRAIEFLISQKDFNNNHIHIYTDSEYTINCILKWGKKWEQNGWINSKKQEISNKNLIIKLYNYNKKYTLKFIHVKAHQPEPKNKDSLEHKVWYGNFVADKLAQTASYESIKIQASK